MSTPLETAKSIYDAFSRGDIPAIIDHLDENVAWEHWDTNNYAQQAGVEWLTPRTGKDGAREFFANLAKWQISNCRLVSLMAGESSAAVEFEIEATTATGGKIFEQELHLWHFNPQGKVILFRHYLDTAKHIDAYRGANTCGPAVQPLATVASA